jgi:hypothetical protein
MMTYWCAWNSESRVVSSFQKSISAWISEATLPKRDVSQSSALGLRYHLGMPAPVDGLTSAEAMKSRRAVAADCHSQVFCSRDGECPWKHVQPNEVVRVPNFPFEQEAKVDDPMVQLTAVPRVRVTVVMKTIKACGRWLSSALGPEIVPVRGLSG